MEDDKQGGLQPPVGGGESQGGARPGQARKRRPKGGLAGFFGHGGQSVQAYQGGSNPNATTEEEGGDGNEPE